MPKEKTIGVIGSRRRDTDLDYAKTRKVFWSVAKRGDLIVSGGCAKGGDRFAECIAKKDACPIRIHRPDQTQWNPLLPYRAAYAVIAYARNVLIANDADVLIAVIAEDRKGGTEHTIKCFLKKLCLTEKEAVRQGKLILV